MFTDCDRGEFRTLIEVDTGLPHGRPLSRPERRLNKPADPDARRSHLVPGTLGDVTILSGDVTAATPNEIRGMT